MNPQGFTKTSLSRIWR